MIEASSGSTAVSEAYFARLLGLPFIAVMPRSTGGRSPDRVLRGRCHFVERAAEVYDASRQLAREQAGTTWTSSPTPSAHRLARQQQHC